MTMHRQAGTASLWFAVMSGATAVSAQDPGAPLTVARERSATQIFRARGKTRAEVHEYIRARHTVLDEIASSRPLESIDAQISFREYLDVAAFKSRMKASPLRVVALSFGWQDQMSGYELQNGESLDAALQRVAGIHRAFLEELHASAREELEGKSTARTTGDDLERHATFAAHASEVKKTFERRGLLVFGVRVRGPASAIKQMKDRDVLIRLADPLWDPGTLFPAARRVGVPISPYEHEKR